VAGWQQK